jgi:hypothetical protein
MKAVQWRSYDGKRHWYMSRSRERYPNVTDMTNVFGDGKPVTPLRKFYRSSSSRSAEVPR